MAPATDSREITYKNGSISQSFQDSIQIKSTLHAYRENPPPGNPHLRKFTSGERLRVTGTTIKNDTIELTLESDPVNYVRYIATTLKFAGPDKKLPLAPEAFEGRGRGDDARCDAGEDRGSLSCASLVRLCRRRSESSGQPADDTCTRRQRQAS